MLHIDLPTQAQIEKLLAYRGGPAVSIYLRTTPLTQDAQADRIELKNQLRAAVEEMEAGDVAKRVVRSISESIELVIEDDGFWTEQANSLAIFAWPEGIRTFRLPNHLTNIVEVSDRFHVKPLIRSVTFPHHAYVLAIGTGAVRLIEVTADLPPHVVPVPGLPRGMADALGKRSHLERTDGLRSGLSTSENGMLTRYARIVDQALRPVLTGHEWPLLLAAPDSLAPIYRSVNSYAHLADQVIAGSADHTPDHELAAQARTLLDEIYASQIRDIGALFAARSAQGRATTDIAQAARAATFGAVDTLLVDMDAVVPGTVADEDGAVTFADQPGPDNYGVVDEIARRAMQSGARVIAARQADIPQSAPLAALLRYAI